jgi:hypothetical protein
MQLSFRLFSTLLYLFWIRTWPFRVTALEFLCLQEDRARTIYPVTNVLRHSKLYHILKYKSPTTLIDFRGLILDDKCWTIIINNLIIESLFVIHIWSIQKGLHTVMWCLKGRTAEPEEMDVARQCHGKQISAATNTHLNRRTAGSGVFCVVCARL